MIFVEAIKMNDGSFTLGLFWTEDTTLNSEVKTEYRAFFGTNSC